MRSRIANTTRLGVFAFDAGRVSHSLILSLPLSAIHIIPLSFSLARSPPLFHTLSAPALWDIAFTRDPDTGADVVLNLHRNQLTARTIATGQVLWADTTALRHVQDDAVIATKTSSEYFAIRIHFDHTQPPNNSDNFSITTPF
jgi:hypothetical protein